MNLVERAKNILLNPKTEWEVIKGESISNQDLFMKYALILAAIPAIAGFIGFSFFGISYGFGTAAISFGHSFTWAILTYILSLVGIYVIAFIIDVLAPTFGCVKDLNAALKIVVFSYTAAWVAGIFSIIPALSFIGMLGGIYSLVLMYMGLQRVKDVPKEKMIGYFIATLVVSIIVYAIIGAIVGGIAFGGIVASSVL